MNVEEISSNSLDLIDKLGARLRRFSLSGFLKGNVHLIVLENYEEENEDDKNEKMKNEGFITFLSFFELNLKKNQFFWSEYNF